MRTKVVFGMLAWLTCLGSLMAAEQKIAVIDLRRVFDDYYKTKAADSKLKDEAADLEKERNILLDQYQKASDEYKKALDDANNQAVSSDERDKRKKTAETKLFEIKDLEQQITQFDKKATTMLQEKQRQMRENILGEIRTIVNTKAKSSGFTLVFDTASESFNKTPVLLYNSGENDLTDMVLAQLNATAPPDLKVENKKAK